MTLKERMDRLDRNAKILEMIAAKYDEGSREYAVLRYAGIAMFYVLTADYERFEQYLANFDGDLTPERRAYLVELGIDPDADIPDDV